MAISRAEIEVVLALCAMEKHTLACEIFLLFGKFLEDIPILGGP